MTRNKRRLVVAVSAAASRAEGDEARVDELLDLLCDHRVPEMPASESVSRIVQQYMHAASEVNHAMS